MRAPDVLLADGGGSWAGHEAAHGSLSVCLPLLLLPGHGPVSLCLTPCVPAFVMATDEPGGRGFTAQNTRSGHVIHPTRARAAHRPRRHPLARGLATECLRQRGRASCAAHRAMLACRSRSGFSPDSAPEQTGARWFAFSAIFGAHRPPPRPREPPRPRPRLCPPPPRDPRPPDEEPRPRPPPPRGADPRPRNDEPPRPRPAAAGPALGARPLPRPPLALLPRPRPPELLPRPRPALALLPRPRPRDSDPREGLRSVRERFSPTLLAAPSAGAVVWKPLKLAVRLRCLRASGGWVTHSYAPHGAILGLFGTRPHAAPTTCTRASTARQEGDAPFLEEGCLALVLSDRLVRGREHTHRPVLELSLVQGQRLLARGHRLHTR